VAQHPQSQLVVDNIEYIHLQPQEQVALLQTTCLLTQWLTAWLLLAAVLMVIVAAVVVAVVA
jgi:hypothetical protein